MSRLLSLEYENEARRRARGETPLHRCSRCKLWRPFDCFCRCRARPEGLNTVCKQCVRAHASPRPEYMNEWYLANKERTKERRRVASKKHRATPKAKQQKLKREREDRQKRPEFYRSRDRSHNHKRRGRGLRTSGTLTAAGWETLVASSTACHWCKRRWTNRRKPTLDHVVPLSKGGENTLQNSVCACLRCNTSKNSRLVNPATGQGILL
jgi:5-methylcytosine-specific restriction endonuclease McrA